MSDKIKFFFFTLLILTPGGSSFIYGQTPLVTGQINKYAKVNSVGVDFVTVSDVSDFLPGDTVMVIQMSGAIINASTTLPGNLQNYVGSPGYYEFLVISGINGGTGRITFTRNLLKTYDPEGKVQIIKVRSVSNAVVNSELSCMDWDSTTVKGGVLAFIVKGVLDLNANINVSGRGFKGGKVSQGSGLCQELNDTIKYYFYNIWSTISGYKGEGLGFRSDGGLSIYPGLARGKGVTLTGGGGGNGHFSGGGGGSNYGAGSSGDVEILGCTVRLTGGNGGYSMSPTILNGGVFMGGGGGASIYNGTANTSAGGRGGGIVIILADSIAGNGRVISALGSEPNPNTVTTSAAGGGGGGGSIIISTRYFASNPVLSANGGKGGNTVNPSGAGGGGGGGLIWTKSAYAGTATIAGGLSGLNNGTDPDRDGSPGAIWTNLNLPLNGFLFNAVYSARTLNQIDSICEGMVPPTITGTLPTGGDGNYTYQWQKSYNDMPPWSNVPGTGVSYTPSTPETATVWFHRIVTEGGGITDISKSVQIIVHPLITGNLVGTDTTICNNQNPGQLYPLNTSPGGGTGLYFYNWERSDNNILWDAADGNGSMDVYDPPVLTATQYYHRIVNSGACTDISSSVMVTVLPSIGANTILADQTICQGSTFNNLTGSTPTGGASPTYTYLWKTSPDNSSWTAAAGVNTNIGYDPQNDSPGEYYYKRIVYSGLNNTCQDTSTSVRLISHPVITGNTVNAAQTICEGSSPLTLDGSVPGGGAGAGTYTYLWQNSLNGTSFSNMPGVTSEDFPGEALTVSTWYRRIANSSVCTNTGNDIKITVDPSIIDFQIGLAASDHDTICTGQAPGLLQGTPAGGLGTYTFQWATSTDNTNFSNLPATTEVYQPGVLTSTTWFRRTVFSGTCSEQPTFKITVLPVIGNNTITADQRVCNTITPAQLTGSAPSGGDGSFRYLWEKKDAASPDWVNAVGTNNTSNYQPPVLGGDTQFRRNIFSGESNCCTSVSPVVTVIVDIMPLNVTAGPDRILLPYQFAMNLEGAFDGTGTCLWSVVSNAGDPALEDINDRGSAVRKLGFGENIFEFRVTNNTCVADPDEVIITVPEVFIPEGITPNDDGLNDYFVVAGLEYTRNELVVINTGGAVVYRTDDYRSTDTEHAWNGLDNYGEPLPEGTYYFLLTIKGALDISIPDYVAHISGFIIIRR